MTTLTELLNNPEVHYPGNFDTPERAVALLTGLCQDAAIEIERLNKAVVDEREACAKDGQDAARYRHMRNNAQFQSRNGPGLYWYLPRFSDGDEGQRLDDAIDAAIRARSNT